MPPIHRRTVILTLAAGVLTSCAMRPYTTPPSEKERAALGIARIDFEPTSFAFDSTALTFDSTLAAFDSTVASESASLLERELTVML